MGNLDSWKNLTSKETHFDYKRIDTEKQLAEFMSVQTQGWYFRGMHEARYRIFSSSQREWIQKELRNRFGDYDVFINDLISEAKSINGGFIPKMLEKFGTNANELVLLSFLQHYGAPTPLIDFTHDKNIALFFAVDGARYTPGDGIENYVSIYGLPSDQGDLTNLRDIIKNAKDKLAGIATKYGKDSIEQADGRLETYDQAVKWNTMLSIDDDGAGPGDYRTGISSNINIVAQMGLFILNPRPDIPLDEQFDGITVTNFSGQRSARIFYGRMHCWDIHKSLIAKVEAELHNRNIDRSTMYPDNSTLAKKTYLNVLSS